MGETSPSFGRRGIASAAWTSRRSERRSLAARGSTSCTDRQSGSSRGFGPGRWTSFSRTSSSTWNSLERTTNRSSLSSDELSSREGSTPTPYVRCPTVGTGGESAWVPTRSTSRPMGRCSTFSLKRTRGPCVAAGSGVFGAGRGPRRAEVSRSGCCTFSNGNPRPAQGDGASYSFTSFQIASMGQERAHRMSERER